MTIRIFDHGRLVNSIIADEKFANYYCNKYGYTYEIDADSIDEIELIKNEISDFEKFYINAIEGI